MHKIAFSVSISSITGGVYAQAKTTDKLYQDITQVIDVQELQENVKEFFSTFPAPRIK